ncbi:MAG TPA: transglycosylase domain-containing protein [Anaerolineae bacterium]|nr:transglycosylase domain-containing protein [Anaerolineae bacterium]
MSRQKSKQKRGCFYRLMVWTFWLGVVGMVAGLLVAGGVYMYLNDLLADSINRVVYYEGYGTGGYPRFFDRNGILLFELKTSEERRYIPLDEMPASVLHATTTVEDDTFWTNMGVDPLAIVAAIKYNVTSEGRPIGASTITQQLVRHVAFSYEDRVAASYDRKIREIFIAFQLTRQRSKHDILEMYLNEIYYGNLAYGIEAASQTYFNKRAEELNLAEAAFLAGLPQSPIQLDPYSNFEGAKARQQFILDLMYDDGKIDYVAYQVARGRNLHLAEQVPIEVEIANGVLEAPHFIVYVRQILESKYGADLIRDGWQVTTSLDLEMHRMAEAAMREHVANRAAVHDVSNGSVVILKPDTGEILAMVGSLDYFNAAIDGQVNIALQPRQPGSSIKPIVYAAAMGKGWTAGHVIWDVPIKLELAPGQEMVPVNYDRRYHGPVLLRDALANSYNIPPIQITRDIGVQEVIATGRKMGIVSLTEPPGYYGLAISLGGGEVPLLEMTHAYATLANEGQKPTLTPVLRIENSRGELVFDFIRDQIPAVNAIDSGIAYILSDILSDNRARTPAMGANSSLRLPFPAAVKTGTTNDYRDNWTIGYTPGVVVGVWSGNADGHPMRDSSGLFGAAPVWNRVMQSIYASPSMVESLRVGTEMPPTWYELPNDIEQRDVCLPRGTGGSVCTATRSELFIRGGTVQTVARVGYNTNAMDNPGAWTLATLAATGDQSIALRPLADGTTPPPSSRCVINMRPAPDEAIVRLYLPVPPYYPDEVYARLWARQAGYVMAPPTMCPVSSVRAVTNSNVIIGERSGGSVGNGSGVVIGNGNNGGGGTSGGGSSSPPVSGRLAVISSPSAGAQIQGDIDIVGTANFNAAEVQFYKVEIGSGSNPSSWVTIGTTHSQPVVNGYLETLPASNLPAGPYVIRLVLVQTDGNFQQPYSVPITVVR